MVVLLNPSLGNLPLYEVCMFRLALLVVCCLPSLAEAQLLRGRIFPNASWNAPNSASCPGGVCPTSAPVPGHWTYPGTISNHLESDHGVATSGMSRQEQLNLHDALHEGRPVTRSVPRGLPAPVTNYYYPAPQVSNSGGSTGSFRSYGSTGSAPVNYSSVGSTVVYSTPVCPPCPPQEPQSFNSSGSAASVSAFGIRDRLAFKRTLLAKAKNLIEPGVTDSRELSPGKITQDQYDALSLAIKIPGVASKIEAALQETAVENGLAGTQAIDWNQLADFIERMIPIILKLIELFS